MAEITGETSYQITAYDIFPDGDLVYASIYLKLQAAIVHHIDIGAELFLTETSHLTAGWNWVSAPIVEQEEDRTDDLEFFGDRPDDGVIEGDLDQNLEL